MQSKDPDPSSVQSSSSDDSIVSESEEDEYLVSSEISSSSETEEDPCEKASNTEPCKDTTISPSRGGQWKRKIGEGQAVKNLMCGTSYSASAGGNGDGNGGKKEVLPEGWNGQEVTLFRMLQPIYGHNYCSIAELIATKTCYQV